MASKINYITKDYTAERDKLPVSILSANNKKGYTELGWTMSMLFKNCFRKLLYDWIIEWMTEIYKHI